jgi:hypothetical protein
MYALLPQGDLRRCTGCGFMFFDSVKIGYDPLQVFARAYAGHEQRAGMHDFFFKMKVRMDADRAAIDPVRMLNSAQQDTVSLIRQRVPTGGAILDIGCGPGYFMRVMRSHGYTPCGLDVADPVVRLLHREGSPVWHGTIHTVPAGWVDPEVCTAFFMLHHVLDPVGFLRTVRTKFPHALLIVAAHNDLGNGIPPVAERRVPPRTYSWWGAEHLQLAMRAAGYRSDVWLVKPRPRDGSVSVSMGVYLWLRQRCPSMAKTFLRCHYRTLPLSGWVRTVWDYGIRKFNSPVLAVGTPRPWPHPMGEPKTSSSSSRSTPR